MSDPAEGRRIVEQVNLLRGAYIGSYAQVEFLLADICVKAWELPEYKHLRAKFPYKADSRVSAANALFACAGPFAKYRDEIHGLFEELLRFEEFRDFIAHGLLRIDIRRPDFSLHMRMYKPEKEGLKVGTLDIPINDFAHAVQQIVSFTHRLVMLFRRIYTEQKLEALPAELDRVNPHPFGLTRQMNVRYWHLADIGLCSAFDAKRTCGISAPIG